MKYLIEGYTVQSVDHRITHGSHETEDETDVAEAVGAYLERGWHVQVWQQVTPEEINRIMGAE